MSLIIEDNAIVLFQGDSITDAGRNRDVHEGLGAGYAMMTAAWFSARYPERHVTFLNRGIGGDRVTSLKDRWQEDCLDLSPTWVSIMIGINDTWRAFDSGDPTSSESYEQDYRHILEQVRDQLGAKIILMEPFVLHHPEDRKEWRGDLNPRVEIVHKLAAEFDAKLVKLDKIFEAKTAAVPPAYWADDGVHPTEQGHALIAQSWLDAVGA
jgi:lysophospholipase L1-like esterase